MLKAKLDSVRKNKKGFSLIELIIVVAIMVALIAVLAPSYVKYVQKSRDSALATAAEDLATAIKTFYADPECEYKPESEDMEVTLSTSNKKLEITSEIPDSAWNAILAYSGIDSDKAMGKASYNYVITVESTGKVTVSSVEA